jgi:hypothetical protein
VSLLPVYLAGERVERLEQAIKGELIEAGWKECEPVGPNRPAR